MLDQLIWALSLYGFLVASGVVIALASQKLVEWWL